MVASRVPASRSCLPRSFPRLRSSSCRHRMKPILTTYSHVPHPRSNSTDAQRRIGLPPSYGTPRRRTYFIVVSNKSFELLLSTYILLHCYIALWHDLLPCFFYCFGLFFSPRFSCRCGFFDRLSLLSSFPSHPLNKPHLFLLMRIVFSDRVLRWSSSYTHPHSRSLHTIPGSLQHLLLAPSMVFHSLFVRVP